MENPFFALAIQVERYIEIHDTADEEVLRRQFELSHADCETVLAWLTLRGLVALRMRNGHREVLLAHRRASC